MTACFRCHSQGETPEGGLEGARRVLRMPPAGFRAQAGKPLRAGLLPREATRSSPRSRPRASRAATAQGRESHEATASEATAEERQQELPRTPWAPAWSIPRRSTSATRATPRSSARTATGCPCRTPRTSRRCTAPSARRARSRACMCHGDADTFCDECHHGSSMNVPYTAGTKWSTKHPATVVAGRREHVLRLPQPHVLRQLPRERARQAELGYGVRGRCARSLQTSAC